MTPQEERALAAAIAYGWKEDTSPATEMSGERWYRRDPCTPPVREETLIERYWDAANAFVTAGPALAVGSSSGPTLHSDERSVSHFCGRYKGHLIQVERDHPTQAFAFLVVRPDGTRAADGIADKDMTMREVVVHALTGALLLPSINSLGRAAPDHFNNLNAMHEAEKTLDDNQLSVYCRHLLRLTQEWKPYWGTTRVAFATAAQRVEAFLWTIGKWKDDQ